MAHAVQLGAETRAGSKIWGDWEKISEEATTLIRKQELFDSCGPTCAEALLKERGFKGITAERIIAEQASSSSELKRLSKAMNDLSGTKNWMEGGVNFQTAEDLQSVISRIVARRGSFMAVVRAETRHAIIVDGMEAPGLIRIRDPWDGTTYLMRPSEFHSIFLGEGIFHTPK